MCACLHITFIFAFFPFYRNKKRKQNAKLHQNLFAYLNMMIDGMCSMHLWNSRPGPKIAGTFYAWWDLLGFSERKFAVHFGNYRKFFYFLALNFRMNFLVSEPIVIVSFSCFRPCNTLGIVFQVFWLFLHGQTRFGVLCQNIMEHSTQTSTTTHIRTCRQTVFSM